MKAKPTGVPTTVYLKPGEKILVVHEDRYYRLGDPIDEVIAGHMLGNAVPVQWCSVEQRWGS